MRVRVDNLLAVVDVGGAIDAHKGVAPPIEVCLRAPEETERERKRERGRERERETERERERKRERARGRKRERARGRESV